MTTIIPPRTVRSAPNGQGPHADLTSRPTGVTLLADRAQAIGILLVCAGICRLAYMG